MRKRLTSALFTAALALGVPLAVAAPAQAMIGCQVTKEWPATAWASCAAGPGTVRVVGTCWHSGGDYYQTLYGPWVFAGNRSYVVCQGAGVYMVAASYQT